MREESLRAFVERRTDGNERILSSGHLPIKRFFALDQDVYADGALTERAKELMGLVGSTVLRCNDCISYHLQAATECGASREEIVEALAIALVIGGSITIPHLRHAFTLLDELQGGAVADRQSKDTGE
jgi:AhpD family alkylhydroperoxidase